MIESDCWGFSPKRKWFITNFYRIMTPLMLNRTMCWQKLDQIWVAQSSFGTSKWEQGIGLDNSIGAVFICFCFIHKHIKWMTDSALNVIIFIRLTYGTLRQLWHNVIRTELYFLEYLALLIIVLLSASLFLLYLLSACLYRFICEYDSVPFPWNNEILDSWSKMGHFLDILICKTRLSIYYRDM